MRDIDKPALPALAEWRSQHMPALSVSVGRYSLSRGAADSDNGL